MKPMQSASEFRQPRRPNEKRSCPRYPFSPAVEALDVLANTRIIGRLSDIARNGCYVDTISPFAAEAAVALTILRDREAFKTLAKVVYSQIGMGMGLSFTRAEPEQLQILGTWLDELAGENAKPKSSGHPEPAHVHGAPKLIDQELRDSFAELTRLLSIKHVISDSERAELCRKLTR
jgi:hypothetical protein